MSTALSVRTAEEIKEMILSGEYPTGAKIPNEQELIEKFSVSRSTLREAIKILVSQNVLEIRRGIGTYVMNTPGVSDDPLGLAFLSREERFIALSEFRILLEPQVAGLAAEHATPEEAEELIKLASESKQILERLYRTHSAALNDKAGEQDILFHSAVYQSCHNPVIDRIFQCCETVLGEAYTTAGYRGRHRQYSYADTHLQIAKAIQRHDRELAILLMRRHVLSSDDFYREALNDFPTKG